MSITYIAFYPSDWLAGTRGLSAAETGIYITLIAKMYEMAGPIERDDERLSRLCGCTRRHFVKGLEQLMDEGKIVEVDGFLINERVEVEIQNAAKVSAKARSAAESRWKRKSRKNNGCSDAVASVGHMPQRCQPEPERKGKPDGFPKSAPVARLPIDEPEKAKPSRGERLPDDWQLPLGWARAAMELDFEGARFSESEIRWQADKFRDYWHGVSGSKGVKKDWKATWLNWCRSDLERKRKVQSPPKHDKQSSELSYWARQGRKYREQGGG